MLKRAFDVVVAGVGLALVSPVLLVLAATIKLTSSGPVFYRGVRAGLGGRPFRIFKFRSMVQNAERLGGPSTSGDDPRLTRIGRTMRQYKLDELPQLVNVLLGDMSLVGPRPDVLAEVEQYTSEQRQVLALRPGITDWASIWNSNEESALVGAADPHAAYKQLIQPTKLRLQLAYFRERTFLIDIEILLSTVVKLFRPNWLPGRLKPYGRPVPASTAHDVQSS
jgi:lipopolysaccharide/colanic/teichoic acid biosynthesis glycosyltransferase